MVLMWGIGSAAGNTKATAPTETKALSSRSELSPRETEIESRYGVQESSEYQESGALPILSGAGAFTFVLCLAALATLLVSYFMKYRRLPALGKKREMPRVRVKVLESIPLGQRRFLTLIEADGEVHLLGMTPAQVNYLTKLPGRQGSEEALEEQRSKVTAKRAMQPPSLMQQLNGKGVNGRSTENFEEQYKQLRSMLGGK
jgi:flagellar biogenesis protein FliO